MSQAVVAYKVGKKRSVQVCTDRFAVASLIDRLRGRFDQLAIYADWKKGTIETCSLARNRGCKIVRGTPRFKRRATDGSLPLVIAVRRSQRQF